MQCEKIVIKKRGICIGDLNKKIILHTRDIDSPDTPLDFDYDQVLTTKEIIWAAIQTVSGQLGSGIAIFDGSELIGNASHLVYIRYNKNITSENFMEFESNYYRILRIENMDQNNTIMKMYCNIRGTVNNEVNKQ